MINLIIFNNAVMVLIFIISIIKTMLTYKINRSKVLIDFSTFYVFVLFFIVSITLALPGLLFESVFFINGLMALSRFFVIMSAGYFIRVSLEIWHKQGPKKILFNTYVFLSVIMSITSYITSRSPISPIEINQAKYAVSFEHPAVSLTVGIILAIAAILICFFFFINGLKSDDSLIKKRSLILGAGMFIVLISIIIHFMMGFLPDFSVIAYSISTMVGWFGFLTLLIGILFKQRKT